MAYNGFVKQDLHAWAMAVAEYDGHPTQSTEELKNYILTLYGYVGILYLKNEKDKARLYNDRIEASVAKFQDRSTDHAFINAMNGACYGYKVMLNSSVSSMYNLMKCLAYIEDAVEADSTSPFGWVEMGNVKFQMARFLGGDFSEISEYYLRAIAIYETSGHDLSCNWHYINSLLFHAKCFEEQGLPEKAVAVYQKIIALAPEFDGAKRWMKKQNDLIVRR